ARRAGRVVQKQRLRRRGRDPAADARLGLVETWTLPLSQFTAPRFDVLQYFYFIGTSQATPHVSGVAAMLVQQGFTDPGAIEAALEKFAIDPSSRNQRNGTRDNDVGFGEINARNTLRGLGL